MEDYRVKVGDKVKFFFSGNVSVFGDVLYIPVATGDCWIIQTYYEGKKDLIQYIQQFNRMAIYPDGSK